LSVVGLRPREKSGGGGATATLRLSVAVCESEPEVPVNVMLLELAATVEAAVKVMVCGVPGVTVGEEGVAVTPVGRPVMATATPDVKPLIAVTESVVETPVAPPVMLSVVGLRAREKSCGAAATLSVKVVVCERVPLVALKVSVVEEAGAVAAAESVMAWGIPGETVKEEGAAVTPVGRPARTTAADPVKPGSAMAVTMTCWDAAPAVRERVDGVAEIEKSGRIVALEPQPMTARRRQLRVARIDLGLCWGGRVGKCMRLLFLCCRIGTRMGSMDSKRTDQFPWQTVHSAADETRGGKYKLIIRRACISGNASFEAGKGSSSSARALGEGWKER
jgi:hypothetical protein